MQFVVMDAVAKAILETVGAAGYVVSVSTAEGLPAVEAVSEGTGERFVVRAPDLCAAAVELAQQVGIELEDG